jgi:hypothetical protein
MLATNIRTLWVGIVILDLEWPCVGGDIEELRITLPDHGHFISPTRFRIKYTDGLRKKRKLWHFEPLNIDKDWLNPCRWVKEHSDRFQRGQSSPPEKSS